VSPTEPIPPNIAKALTGLAVAMTSPDRVEAICSELSSRLADGVPLIDLIGSVLDIGGQMLAEEDGLLPPVQRAWLTMALIAATESGEVRPVHLKLARLAGAQGEQAKDLRPVLVDELRKARSALGMDKPPPTEPREAVDGEGKGLGLLWLDEDAAALVEPLGAMGSSLAKAWREQATTRWTTAHDPPLPGIDPPPPAALWRLWLPSEKSAGASRFAHALAGCLWAQMKAEWERLKRLGGPAVPRPLVLGVSAALKGGKAIAAGPYAIHDPLHAEPRGAVSLVDGWQDALAPRQRAGLLPELLTETVLQGLDTVAAARLPRLIATTVNQYLRKRRNPQILEWQRGFAGLGAALHLSPKELLRLHDALDAFRVLTLPLPDGSTLEGLWTIRHWPEAPGRPAVLRIELPSVWIPGYVAGLKLKHQGAPDERRLVYLSTPERIPKPTGSGRGHPGQERLVLIIHREFSDRSREYAAQGGIDASDAEWRRWADEAGIGRRGNVLDRIREKWLRAAQVPFWPMLEVLPNGLLRLADKEVHGGLVEQGKIRNRQSAAAQAPRPKRKRRRKWKAPM